MFKLALLALTIGGAALPRAVKASQTYRNATRSARRAAWCATLTPQQVEDVNDATDPAPCLEVR
jgi:hypothetical protein